MQLLRSIMIETNIYISSIVFVSFLLVAEITHAQTADITNKKENIIIESGIILTVKGGLDNKSNSTITNSGTITSTGSWNNNGTFNDSGKVVLNGNSSQNITGTSNFKELEINSGSTVTLLSGTQKVWHTLTLTDGTFDVSADSLILLSNASRTARVGPVQTGASMSGHYTKQRYVSGTDSWRLLTSPMSSADIEGWNDDFTMSGFPGSDHAGWSWVSLYYYDESNTGISDYGWTAPTNTSNALTPGKGYFAWVGENLGDNIAITLDLTSGLTSGTQNITATYTDGPEDDNHDGWNLIGNPYPSDIFWNGNINLSGTLTQYAYLYNPSTSNYDVIDTSSGASIPSHQGFWVKVAAGSGTHNETITFEEQNKAADGNNFLKTSQDSGIVISLSGYGMKNKCSIRFDDDATIQYDWKYDAFKLPSHNPNIPNIAAITDDGLDMFINTLPHDYVNFNVPIRLFWNDSEPSSIPFYELNLNIESLPDNLSHVCIEDLMTNEFITLQEGDNLNFTTSYYVNAPTRFVLHGIGSNCEPISTEIQEHFEERIQVAQNTDAIIVNFNLFEKNNVDIHIFNSLGQFIATKSSSIKHGKIELNKRDISLGTYTVKVTTEKSATSKKILVY